MKKALRKIFSPVLNIFEKGDEAYNYKPLNRKILLFMSVVFMGLAVLVIYFSPDNGDLGYLIPVIVFMALSIVGLIVGLLGNDRAVSNIWGNR